MPQLYWSCFNNNLRHLQGLLHQDGVKFERIDEEILHIGELDHRVLRRTLSFIAERTLRSAALLRSTLEENQRFILFEWPECILVQGELAASDLLSGVQRVGEFSRFDLGIFRVRSDEDGSEIAEINAEEASRELVLANPEKYYGQFAFPEIGGANALFAAGVEAARLRGLGEDTVLVGDPEVFGFSINASVESIVHWRQENFIRVDAFGFSLSDWRASFRELGPSTYELLESDAIDGLVAGWLNEGIRFGLGVVLRGIDDPPVVIPMGSVFQQPSMGSGYQNLASASAGSYMVAAGATVPLVLPAWCLNPTFSPPNGPMMPTSLIAGAVQGSQDAVWDAVRRRYRGYR